MTSLADTAPRSLTDRRLMLCIAILVAVTVVRLIGLAFSQVDLFFDELQYWAWSRELAFGYFSKPPLLAWVIAGAEVVCGSAEACIRAPAPVFYLGTCLVSYAIAKTLYDETTAFWAAMLLTFSAGLAFSSRIISTDVPLLFLWAVALLSYVKLLQGGDWSWGVLLGASFGLGMLAKYAMIYFVLGIAAAAVIDRDARALLRSPSLWLAAAIGVAFDHAERDLERAEQLRHADACRPQHPGRRRRLRSDAGTGIHREPVRGVRAGDVQRAADRAGAGDEARDRPRRPADAVLRRSHAGCW